MQRAITLKNAKDNYLKKIIFFLLSILFMSLINFMVSCVEHEKSFIVTGPDHGPHCLQRLSAYDKSQLTASKKELKFVLMHTQKLPLSHVSPFYFRTRIQISDDSP